MNTVKFTKYRTASCSDTVEYDVKIAPIGKLVTLQNFNAGWAMFFGREEHHHDTYLPTELFVRKPENVTPRRARVFQTSLYLYRHLVLDNDELYAHYRRLGETFPGTYAHEAVVFVEVYGNEGSDGHVDFQLVGYRFVGEKALDNHDGWMGTADVVLDNMPGDSA